MTAPAPSASVETFFEHDEYCAAFLGADPEAADLEPVVTAASDKLTKGVAARTAAQRALNRATAVRNFNFRAVMASVDALERKASAAFEEGESAPGYQRLFPKTPAQFAKTAIEDRTKVFDELVAQAESSETPAALAKPVKALSSAWDRYQAAVARFVAAQGALSKARGREESAKLDNITALRQLEGELTVRFPNNPKRVRDYFPPPKAAKKPPEEPGTTTTLAPGTTTTAAP